MITREHIVPMMLAACPSLEATWAGYIKDPTFEPDLYYVHAGEFARHLIAQLASGDTTEFAAVFDVIERLHIEGDAYVREFATVGVLEAIQNIAGDPTAEAFVRSLGPVSREAWDQLNAFWSGERA